jgi:PAS domain S-box-containing protein
MLTVLKSFLKPPQAKNSESQEKARLLDRLLLGLICLDLILFSASVLVHPNEYVNRMALYGLSLFVFVGLYVLNRRGYPNFTAILLSIMFFVLVVIAVVLTHHSNLIAATGFLLVVFCAGLLIGRQAALIMGLVSAITSFVMMFIFPGIYGEGMSETLYIWLVYLGLLMSGTMLLYLVMGSLSESQSQLRERAFLLDQIADAVITTDLEQRIVSWNRAAERLYGWTSAEVMNQPLYQFVATEYPDGDFDDGKSYQQLMETGQWRGEVVQKNRAGQSIPVLASVTLLRDTKNNISGMVGVNRDNREGKELEEHRLYTKLLESDLKKEQELSNFKDRILSTVSHEFRTPLAVIQSSVEILRRHQEKFSPEQVAERLAKIQRQIGRLSHLLDDVSEYARGSQQRQSKPEEIELLPFLEELIEEYRLMNPSYPLDLKLGQLPTIFYAERRILEHILTNLLSNAIKYSPEGGKIDFSASRIDGIVEFRVDDRGIGIPLEDHPRIFESFHRARNVGTIPGTGIGLAIVKQNVSNMGGSIQFVSEQGRGSSFIVKLPFVKSPSTETIFP